tara:strand:- start:1687 stop:2199 length:513 start_codon:yes stop_codon:yes gene_type:complete
MSVNINSSTPQQTSLVIGQIIFRNTYKAIVSLKPLFYISILSGKELLWLVTQQETAKPSQLLLDIQKHLEEINTILNKKKTTETSTDNKKRTDPVTTVTETDVTNTLEQQLKNTLSKYSNQAINMIKVLRDISSPVGKIALVVSRRYLTYTSFKYAFDVTSQTIEVVIKN